MREANAAGALKSPLKKPPTLAVAGLKGKQLIKTAYAAASPNHVLDDTSNAPTTPTIGCVDEKGLNPL